MNISFTSGPEHCSVTLQHLSPKQFKELNRIFAAVELELLTKDERQLHDQIGRVLSRITLVETPTPVVDGNQTEQEEEL